MIIELKKLGMHLINCQISRELLYFETGFLFCFLFVALNLSFSRE